MAGWCNSSIIGSYPIDLGAIPNPASSNLQAT